MWLPSLHPQTTRQRSCPTDKSQAASSRTGQEPGLAFTDTACRTPAASHLTTETVSSHPISTCVPQTSDHVHGWPCSPSDGLHPKSAPFASQFHPVWGHCSGSAPTHSCTHTHTRAHTHPPYSLYPHSILVFSSSRSFTFCSPKHPPCNVSFAGNTNRPCLVISDPF